MLGQVTRCIFIGMIHTFHTESPRKMEVIFLMMFRQNYSKGKESKLQSTFKELPENRPIFPKQITEIKFDGLITPLKGIRNLGSLWFFWRFLGIFKDYLGLFGIFGISSLKVYRIFCRLLRLD